jgi:hypothetical protein
MSETLSKQLDADLVHPTLEHMGVIPNPAPKRNDDAELRSDAEIVSFPEQYADVELSNDRPDASRSIQQQATREEICTERLEQPANVSRPQRPDMADVLHVGCGAYEQAKLPQVFRQIHWREIRLDIDPTVRPDFVASITDMRIISDGSVRCGVFIPQH